MKAEEILKFYKVLEKMKCNTRHSWTTNGRQESVADHSFSTAFLAMLIADEFPNQMCIRDRSSREQIDILNTVNLDFSEEVEKGSLIPLDELIASVDGLKDILPDWLWELGSVDGQIYMVPNYQRASNMNYLVTPTEWLEKYGDAKKIEETLKMDDLSLIHI